jgi:hypothetical protein
MELLHEIGGNLLVGFEGLDGSGLVILHKAAVTGHVSTEDSGELSLEFVLCHGQPPWEEGLANTGSEG